MAHWLELEALYPEMEEATLGCWLVTEGETISVGQSVAELITDKVAYEYQSPEAGTLLIRVVAEKSVMPVGTVLAAIGTAGESVDDLEAIRERNRQLAAERDAKLRALQDATAGSTEACSSARPAGGAVRATPAARRLARERGIDLATIHGSGPGGMITVDDLPG